MFGGEPGLWVWAPGTCTHVGARWGTLGHVRARCHFGFFFGGRLDGMLVGGYVGARWGTLGHVLHARFGARFGGLVGARWGARAPKTCPNVPHNSPDAPCLTKLANNKHTVGARFALGGGNVRTRFGARFGGAALGQFWGVLGHASFGRQNTHGTCFGGARFGAAFWELLGTLLGHVGVGAH